ncbi:hypothetical protein D3C72_1177240 [compost metagenome]
MPAKEFRQRMQHDVSAVFQRPQQIGARHGVVNDQRQAVPVGDIGNRGYIHESTAGIGKAFDEDGACAVVDLRLEAGRIGGVSPAHLPVEALEGVTELVDRAAIKLTSGDEIVAGLQERMEDQQLRGMAGCHGKRRRAAFQRRHALFQNSLGGVHDSRVDIAELFQSEQGGGVIGVAESKGRRLINGCRTRAGGRIRLCARVDGQR